MTHVGAAVAMSLALATAPCVAQSPKPAPPPSRSAVIAAARKIISRAHYCALITLGADGHPQARVVDPFPPDSDFTIWIATNALTRKVEQIKRDPRVTVYCFDAGDPGYVTLLAKAQVIDDPREKAKRWKPEWKSFYKNENRGADYVLIRAKPFRMEVVSIGQKINNDPVTWAPVSIAFP